MPETDSSPENNKAPQEERADKADVPESTDDYFERVNQRLKNKKKEKNSRFGKSRKKAPEPKEEPKQPSPAENKAELPPKETVTQMPTIEASVPEEPSTEQIEQQQTSEKSVPLTAESEPQPIEQVKPKKRGVFGSFSLRRKSKESPAEEMPAAETSQEIPIVEAVPVEQQPSVEVTEPQSPPAEPSAETTPIVAEAETVPMPVEEVKPKKKGFFSFFSGFRRKPKESLAEKLPLPPEDIQVSPETVSVSPTDALTQTPTVISQEAAPTAETESQPETVPVTPEPVPVTPPFEYSDSIEDITKYAQHFEPVTDAKRSVVCLGEYPIHMLLKSRFAGKPEGILPLFIDKSSRDIIQWSQAKLNPHYIIGLDAELDTHFWYNIVPNVSSDSAFMSRLKNKPVEKLQNAIMIASVWDGVGSALLPTLIGQFNEWKINSVALALLPSKLQPLESQFNAFSAVGKCATMNSATLVLLGRDSLESYIGVDRRGHLLDGNVVANYLIDFMLSKETLVEELSELSKTFDSKLFTLLFGTGTSLKIYGSVENILDIALNKVFLTFDISSSSLVYVLVRMPFSLKEKLTRGKVELAVANWFKDKATLNSIHVAEPVYVEDSNDRIDIALFVGGFDSTKIFSSVEKKVVAMKNQAVKNGFLKEAEWKEIVKNLVG